MTFWTSEKLLEELKYDKIIPNASASRVKCGAYELSMGPEYFVSANAEGKRQSVKQVLEVNQQFVIPPGQFGLLLTEETIAIPANAIGFISIKFGKKFKGLVNVSGFHVDPGFQGRLKFSVYNAGSKNIPLARGEPVFMLWFSSTDRETSDSYKGPRDHQYEITTEDVFALSGDVASPAQLRKELNTLKLHVKLIISVGSVVITVLLLPIIRTFILELLK